MKKIFCIIISLCLIFGSFSFVFASPTQWDTSDRTLLSQINTALTSTSTGTLLRSVNNIVSALTSSTQQGSLYNGVAYLYDIREALISSSSISTNLPYIATTLGNIWSVLSFTVNGEGISKFVSDIKDIVSTFSTRLANIYTATNNVVTNTAGINNKIDSYDDLLVTNIPFLSALSNNYGNGIWDGNKRVNLLVRSSDGSGNNVSYSLQLGTGNPFSDFLRFSIISSNNQIGYWSDLLVGSKNSRNLLNWIDLSTNSFTPQSGINGIYTYLSGIQNPLARLAYVHASDEEIAARQKAASNQTAVVNGFIDPTGNGSVPSTNFSDLAGISSSIKTNLNTGQSATGIFNVFTDNHSDDWYSEDTYNKLMGISNNRSAKSSGSDYPTPLLDQRMSELTSLFGGEN